MPSGPNFYNENANRAFPFVFGTVGIDTPQQGPLTMKQIPNQWIVDAGFTMGVVAYFDYTADGHLREIPDVVYLKRIYRRGTQVFFEFATTAIGTPNNILTFVREINDQEYITEFVDQEQQPDCSLFLWGGYLVTGDLSSIPNYLNDNDEIIAQSGEAIIEPALINNLFRAYINDINIANDDRTRVTSPDGCPPIEWNHSIGQTFVNARCLKGDIHWKPGFNCNITQDDVTNTLTIAAGVGIGEGQPCKEIPLFDGESSPRGSDNQLLSGGMLCNQVLRAINGLGGPHLSLLAGNGVSIIPEPENHRITIDVNMIGLAVCASEFLQISESI